MSTNSALRARLARLGPVRDVSRHPSSSAERLVLLLHRTGALDRPIDLARRLIASGLSLRAAQAVLNRLAETGWTVCAVDAGRDIVALARDLRRMNVEVRRRRSPTPAMDRIAEIRTRHGLSQREFADLLALDLRTLQNWEQGRNRPDPGTASLVLLFDQAPEQIEELLSEPVV